MTKRALAGWEVEGQMAIEVEQSEATDRTGRPTTSVRGVTARDLERELAEWQCANQAALGDTPVPVEDVLSVL